MSIPRIPGPYQVGLTYCKVPIAKRTYGTAKFKSSAKPAFILEEVAFQVSKWVALQYYITDTGQAISNVGGWIFNFPRSRWLFYPFVLLLYTLLRIPVYTGVPMKKPPTDQKKWQLIIFSHGLAGTSKTYSQLCGKLAAEGNVVIAMEHRDGTAPATIYPVDGKVEAHHYIKVEELDWGDKVTNPTTPMPLRTQQLEIRHIEILEALKAFKSLVQGNTDVLCNSQDYPAWDSWTNQVDTDTIIFDGHSFGGCTGIHLLTSPTPEGYESLPITKAILHDPWMEPLPQAAEDASMQESASQSSLPILVINSEEFTIWKSHFASQQKTFEPWIKRAGEGSTWLTLAKSKHMAFSDFPAFFVKRAPMALHEDMHQLSLAFLNGTLQGYFQANEKRITRELIVDNPDDDKRKQMRAQVGVMVIHDTTA